MRSHAYSLVIREASQTTSSKIWEQRIPNLAILPNRCSFFSFFFPVSFRVGVDLAGHNGLEVQGRAVPHRHGGRYLGHIRRSHPGRFEFRVSFFQFAFRDFTTVFLVYFAFFCWFFFSYDIHMKLFVCSMQCVVILIYRWFSSSWWFLVLCGWNLVVIWLKGPAIFF